LLQRGTTPKDVERTVCPHAQTRAQLFEELSAKGYASSQLQEVAAAYDLALSLFSTLLRPGGKPFLNHLIGTASILARHGAACTVVVAGLVHAAYTFGVFSSEPPGVTPRKRRRVCGAIGEAAEDLVNRYARFTWNSDEIGSLPPRLPGMTAIERNVVFMRLANELEEGADSSLFNWPVERRLLKATYQGLSVDVARALGMLDLAAELEVAYRRNVVEKLPG
jgi:hypothetical protein